jgi:lipopolysaccharide/colanic/teichoic acid biosynthesis glycosyltransferase
MIYNVLKRMFDLIISGLAIVILSPLILIIAILIKRDSPGPVLYQGIRARRNNGSFKMFKFRTMVINADKIGGPSTSGDDPRVTLMGKHLRQYKLDEIPQLFNVFAGSMSFVGPRPEVLSEVETYSAEERQVLSVRPGITDWASIRFHDEGEILKGSSDPHQAYLEKIRPEKMRLALKYVHERSSLVDMQILMKTLVTIFQTRAGR